MEFVDIGDQILKNIHAAGARLLDDVGTGG
jgi:hypothetical protein